MSPFTSKYDEFVRGHAQLSPDEAEGLALFKDRGEGRVRRVPPLNEASTIPERSLFTDYGFEAVGAPRNRALPSNSDATTFDLGLCERHDAPAHGRRAALRSLPHAVAAQRRHADELHAQRRVHRLCATSSRSTRPAAPIRSAGIRPASRSTTSRRSTAERERQSGALRPRRGGETATRRRRDRRDRRVPADAHGRGVSIIRRYLRVPEQPTIASETNHDKETSPPCECEQLSGYSPRPSR